MRSEKLKAFCGHDQKINADKRARPFARRRPELNGQFCKWPYGARKPRERALRSVTLGLKRSFHGNDLTILGYREFQFCWFEMNNQKTSGMSMQILVGFNANKRFVFMGSGISLEGPANDLCHWVFPSEQKNEKAFS